MQQVGHFCVHETPIALDYPSLEIARAFQHVLGGFASTPTPAAKKITIISIPQAGGYFAFDKRDLICNCRSLDALVTTLEWQLINNAVIDATTPIVHAASLTRNAQTILLPGRSGAGKTTLAIALCLNGWHLLSDELSPITLANGTIKPFPRVLCVKTKTLDHLHAVDAHSVLPKKVPKLNGVFTLPPHNFAIAKADTSPPITHILFPHYRPNQKVKLTEINKSDALTKLTACISNRPQLTQESFDAIALKIQHTPCFELNTGALAQTIEAFQYL